jgi:hypothetical protein
MEANEVCTLPPSESPQLNEKPESDVKIGVDLDESISNNGPRKVPFPAPAPSATSVLTPPELTSAEEEKYHLVLQYLKSIESLPTSSAKNNNKETAPLSELEQYFLTRECILRYLRASKWKVEDTKKRIEGTLIWRREYGTDTLSAKTVEDEVLPFQNL